MRDENAVAVSLYGCMYPLSNEDRLERFRPRLALEKVKLEPAPNVQVWMPAVEMSPLRPGPLCSMMISLDDEFSVAPRWTNSELLAMMMGPTIEIGGESFWINFRPAQSLDPSQYIEHDHDHDTDTHRLKRVPKSIVATAIEQVAKENGWR